MLSMLDLFSGIGGFHLGLERAGFKFDKVYFSEIDKYAIEIYKRRFPDAEHLGSVVDIRGAELGRIDVITFGSPCQDFSLAGRRAGMAGERSSLISHALRLIAELRPQLFIWENVKGVFSSNAGADFWAIIQAFADIGDYQIEWQLLNTAWFLPQNRERIYLVGRIADRCTGQIFPITENDNIVKPRERRGLEVQTANCLSARQFKQGRDDTYIKVGTLRTHKDGKGYNYDNQLIQVGQVSNEGSQAGKVFSETGISPTISAGTHGYAMGNIQVGTWRTHDDGKGFREVDNGMCPTTPARAREYGSGQPVIIQPANGRRTHNHKLREIVPALTPSAQAKNSDNNPLVAEHKNRIRRLTPIECERLQGFPDGWTDGHSDTQRYKTLGNAVSVPVVKAVGESILNNTVMEE